MPEHQRTTSAGAIEDLVRRVSGLEQEVRELRANRRSSTLNRGAHDSIPAPQEGMVIIEASDESVWQFSNSEWRRLQGGVAAGVGDGDSGATLVTRYIALSKSMSFWAPGAWTTIDWSDSGLHRTNDIDGTEDSFSTSGGAVLIEGGNYTYDSAGAATHLVIQPGLHFVEVGFYFVLGADLGEFQVGLATQAGRSVLSDGYPLVSLPYSSQMSIAGGANQMSNWMTRVAYLTSEQTVDLAVRHNGSGAINDAVFYLSYATLEIV